MEVKPTELFEALQKAREKPTPPVDAHQSADVKKSASAGACSGDVAPAEDK